MKIHVSLRRTIVVSIVFVLLGAPVIVRAAGLVAAWGDSSAGQCRPPNGLNNLKAIAAGGSHTLALRTDGTVTAWGLNDFNQIDVPADLANVTAIAAGEFHSLALKADGTLVAWTPRTSTFPLPSDQGQFVVPAGLSNIVAIAAGGYQNLVLRSDGTVFSWGDNSGQTNIPAGLAHVVAVAANRYCDLALNSDGVVTAWGSDLTGQTNVPPGLSNVTAIAAGLRHCLALKGDGTVVAWGDNSFGQTNVPLNLANVTAIAAGGGFSLARRADGSIVAWGENSNGQTNVPTGLLNVTAIAAGQFHAVALVPDGPVQIIQQPVPQDIAYTSNATFSVVATGREPLTYQWLLDGNALPENSRYLGVASATLTITNAQLADAGVYTVVVGNAFGSVISTGATLAVISAPFLTSLSPDLTVGAGTFLTLSASAQGTPFIDYQWSFNGTNLAGQTSSSLYLGSVQPRHSGIYSVVVTNTYGSTSGNVVLTVTNTAPTIQPQPPGFPGALLDRVALIGSSTTFAVSAAGSFPLTYQWRLNGDDIPGATKTSLTLTNLRLDQTGYYNVRVSNPFGEAVSRKAFLSVSQIYLAPHEQVFNTPTNIPPGLSNLTAIAAGNYHVLALKTDGQVVTWASTPGISAGTITLPPNLTNITAIAAGGDVSMVLRSNGKVTVWGGGTSPYALTNVPPSASNVIAIATGGQHCLAVRSNGTVVAWGNNPYGQTVVPAGLSNVTAVAAGSGHSLALKADGTLAAWGYNGSGQVPVPAGLSNVIAIAASSTRSVALKEDGHVVVWGASYSTNHATLSNFVAIAVGNSHVLGLKNDGRIVDLNYIQLSISVSNVTAIAEGSGTPAFAAALIGNGSPAMTIQPASQTVVPGATVRLNARAAGIQPLSYQWQLDGQNLVGATNASLRITNVLGPNTGEYRLRVANALGSVTSAAGRLMMPYNTNLAAALNATNLVWNNPTTNAGWFAQIQETHDGSVAAQSGRVGDGQQSVLQTTVTGPGTLTFWWKVSSEATYDYLRLFLDASSTPLAAISGETEWQQLTFSIPTGTHLLKWAYVKDGSVSDGKDAGWLDQVIYLGNPPVIITQPSGQTAALGATVTLAAIVNDAPNLSCQWLKSGNTLPGATTATLILTNVGRKNAGSYALRATNASGSVISSNAVLVVRVPQLLGASRVSPDGGFTFSFGDADGGWLQPGDVAGFEVQTSSNLVDWEVFNEALWVTNGLVTVRDPDRAKHPIRFYRVVEH